MNIKYKNRNRVQIGFTLIELVIYMAIVSIFITGAITFSWNIVTGREKGNVERIVSSSSRIAMSRIGYEVRRALDITSVSATQIVLDNGTNSTTIELVGGTVQITTQGAGPYDLTSNQVAVPELTFTDLSTTGTDSKGIGVALTITQSNAAAVSGFTADTSIYESFELNSPFNDSRTILVDLSSANLASIGTRVEGVTMENISSSDLIITHVYVSWTGTPGGENVTGVQIDGGAVEWTGTSGSGVIIDLSDYVLTSSAGAVDLDYISFDSNMNFSEIDLRFIMDDGSRTLSTLFLTPPAPTSCHEACTNQLFITGVCRKNEPACELNGETYESTGDEFCTGGPQIDTCCCQPLNI